MASPGSAISFPEIDFANGFGEILHNLYKSQMFPGTKV
jgi:hypothetical protein